MIRNGIDRVTDAPYRSLLEHLRLGLVSNMSGISPRHGWRSTVDVLPQLFTVSCLFAPEHGVRGVLGPGEKVSDGRDELTGLYTHSLFEDMVFSPGTDGADAAYAPRADSLRDLDMLVFDMQDVGSRYFTYASTLLCTMRACATNRVPLCVLDRPNPLGGLVTEGGRQADDCVSFIGLMRMPIRHRLTLGELARYCNEAYAPLWRAEAFHALGGHGTSVCQTKPQPAFAGCRHSLQRNLHACGNQCFGGARHNYTLHYHRRPVHPTRKAGRCDECAGAAGTCLQPDILPPRVRQVCRRDLPRCGYPRYGRPRRPGSHAGRIPD